MGGAGGVGEHQLHEVVLVGPGGVRHVAEGDLAVGLAQRLRRHLGAVEREGHGRGGDGGGAIHDQGLNGRGRAVAVRSCGGGGLGEVGALGGRDGGVAVGLQGGAVGGIVDQHAGAGGVDRVEVEGGAVSGLPVQDADRIDAGGRRIHRPDCLVVLVADERLDERAALGGRHLGAEIVARVGADKDLKTVVIVGVGAVGPGGGAEGGDAGRQLQEADHLGREVGGAAVGAGNAGEKARAETGEQVGVRIEQVKRGAVLLEVDGVHIGGAVRVAAGDGDIGHRSAGAVGQRAIDLLQGADEVVGDHGVLGSLYGADKEPPGGGTAQGQFGGSREAVGGGVHRGEPGAGEQDQ